MLTYRLSNQQKKELLVRGQLLQIAIPCNDVDCDPIAFARDSLIEHGELVIDAEIADVAVWRTTKSTGGFSGLMGHVSSDKCNPSPTAIEYLVVVVIATLQYELKPRGRVPLAWPGKAYRDGVEIAEIT